MGGLSQTVFEMMARIIQLIKVKTDPNVGIVESPTTWLVTADMDELLHVTSVERMGINPNFVLLTITIR